MRLLCIVLKVDKLELAVLRSIMIGGFVIVDDFAVEVLN
jgi:hypothetical protein